LRHDRELIAGLEVPAVELLIVTCQTRRLNPDDVAVADGEVRSDTDAPDNRSNVASLNV
jgi:hypothetical protein